METRKPILVDVGTAATALGMGRSSLYRMCKRGLIPSYSAGPRMHGVRVCIAEVMATLRRKPTHPVFEGLAYDRLDKPVRKEQELVQS